MNNVAEGYWIYVGILIESIKTKRSVFDLCKERGMSTLFFKLNGFKP